MSKRYKVLASTLIAGHYFTEGTVLTPAHNIPDEDMKAALHGKFVEEAPEVEGEDAEKIDTAPSLLTDQHETKSVVPVEKAADRKAAEKG